MPFSCPGGVPYDILKPVLERCTAEQLYQLEHYNPYLMEETGPHWQFHCNRDFRGQKLQEYETWRELYLVRINQGDNFYQWRILLRTERAKFVESNLKRKKKEKYIKNGAFVDYIHMRRREREREWGKFASFVEIWDCPNVHFPNPREIKCKELCCRRLSI